MRFLSFSLCLKKRRRPECEALKSVVRSQAQTAWASEFQRVGVMPRMESGGSLRLFVRRHLGTGRGAHLRFCSPLTANMGTAQRDLQPTPTDGYPTSTSRLQASTEKDLKPRLDSILSDEQSQDANAGPTLHKELHMQFLLRNLRQGFPARYSSQDASQPWLIFWTLQGFSVMGVGMDAETKQRLVALDVSSIS